MSVAPHRTRRLVLVPSDPSLASLEEGNRAAFHRALGAPVPASWPPELHDDNTIAYNLRQLRAGDEQAGWWAWYFIREDGEHRELIGSGGFKGPPDGEGRVEAGYSILVEHRGQGYAVEALGGLCAVAAARGANSIVVETLEDLPASIRTAQRAGFDGPVRGSEPGVVQLQRSLVSSDADEDDADLQRA